MVEQNQNPFFELLLNWNEWRGTVREALRHGDEVFARHGTEIADLFDRLALKASKEDLDAALAEMRKCRQSQGEKCNNKAASSDLKALETRVAKAEERLTVLWVKFGFAGLVGGAGGSLLFYLVKHFLLK